MDLSPGLRVKRRHIRLYWSISNYLYQTIVFHQPPTSSRKRTVINSSEFANSKPQNPKKCMKFHQSKTSQTGGTWSCSTQHPCLTHDWPCSNVYARSDGPATAQREKNPRRVGTPSHLDDSMVMNVVDIWKSNSLHHNRKIQVMGGMEDAVQLPQKEHFFVPPEKKHVRNYMELR